MNAPQRAVVASGLTRRFGDVIALDGVDLEIEFGRVVGLLGHNGAGKTTTVNILTTLLSPTGGRAEVCGHDVVREPGKVREQIALAGQQATLDELLTGRENLVLLGCLLGLSRRDAKARAIELLARFGLADAADRAAAATPAACGGGSTSRPACSCRGRSSSSTSPRPAWTPPAAGGLGRGARARRRRHRAAAHHPVPREADRLADRVVVLAGGRGRRRGHAERDEGPRRRPPRRGDPRPRERSRTGALRAGRGGPGPAASSTARGPSARPPRAGPRTSRPRWPRCGPPASRSRGGPAAADARRRLPGAGGRRRGRRRRRARARGGGDERLAARASARETRLLAGRSLRHIPRVPEKLADVTIQPIVFSCCSPTSSAARSACPAAAATAST